jgi:hypothetical protein
VKQARLIWTGLAVIVVAGTAAFAFACGDRAEKTSATAAVAAKGSACTAEMAAQCTPEMAAACAAHQGASAAMAKGAKGTRAVTADARHSGCAAMKGAGAAATTASSECSAHDAASAKVYTASMAPGASSSAKGAAASDCCAAKGAQATRATAAVASPNGQVDAVLVGGPSCSSHAKSARTSASADCEACGDMLVCESDIAQAGGRVQVVPLKNGVMYVYTADASAKVRAVQSAVTRHADRMISLNAAADKVTLCPSCKEIRGAMASGKLAREVVNIDSGCLMMVTSTDSRLVGRLYTIAGLSGNGARLAKS